MELSWRTTGSAYIDDIEALFASGDPDGFRRVFREYAPLVMGTCARILRNQEDAEDVTSEVFLEAWSRRDRYDADRASLRGYLVLLARSRALDRYRARSRHRRPMLHNEGREIETRALMDVTGIEAGPDELVAGRELSELARSAMASLGQAQRETLELSFFEGMSHSQIAEYLELPLGTVKTHIRKGLHELRQVLSKPQPRREHIE